MHGPSPYVSSFGLLLDVVGVILIWGFGLPEPMSRSGAQHLILDPNQPGT